MTSLSSEPSVHKMIPKKFQKDRRSICLISTMSEVPPFIRRDKNMLIEKLFSFGRNESTLGKTQTTSRKSIMESLECRRLMSGSGILEWPSSSQNILSVGGTTLSASPAHEVGDPRRADQSGLSPRRNRHRDRRGDRIRAT